jgi:signal transduction histidine kinase
MKRASSAWSATEYARAAVLACLVAATVLLAGCGRMHADAPPAEYRTAEFAEVDVATLPPEERARLRHVTIESVPTPPDASALTWRPVPLPRLVAWGPGSPGGGKRPVIHWLRIVHPIAADSPRSLAVYVPRFQPGIGQIDFYVNRVHVPLPATRAANHWNQPLLFRVPESALAGQRSVELLIAVLYDARTTYALAPVYVGPWFDLEWRAALRAFVQSGAPEALSYAFLVLGAFAFGFWWRRRTELAYLFFALATVVWCIRTLHYHNVAIRMDSMLYWWMTVNSMSWLMMLVYQFALRFQGRRAPLVEWGLWSLVIVSAVATLPAVRLEPALAATLTYVVQVLVSIGVTVFLTREARRLRTREAIVLAGALWLCIGFGVYDLLLKDARVDPRGVFLLPYAAVFLFGAFLYAVLRRYTYAIDHVERVNASLEDRLAARTRELEASHEKLRAIEREQTLAAERQRLMRDMHDGLGSSLMSSLVAVEQGRLAPAEVARVLRECIDDLKLTIDSLEPIGSDLVTLIATLRYRLGSRLEAAGLRLDWRVADVPPLPWLDALAALEVLRILQEALTNVIKHSGARSVAISTAVDGNEVRVRLVDDGRGFDVARARRESLGRGLPNLERRAAKLGGRIDVTSSSAGTCVELVLLVERRHGDSATAPAAERRGRPIVVAEPGEAAGAAASRPPATESRATA